jgi:hypothetical protein
MIKDWLEGKEFKQIAEISDSTLKRLKRKVRNSNPELLRLENGKCKLHKDLLKEYSCRYYVDFHDLVNYQVRTGKKIDSLNSIWAQYLIGMKWTLMGTLNLQREIPAQTCINHIKRTISTLKIDYPEIEGFFATEKNIERNKGSHIHFFLKTPQQSIEEIKEKIEKEGFKSKKSKNIEIKFYDSSKLGAGYLTKELSNNPDGYGFI